MRFLCILLVRALRGSAPGKLQLSVGEAACAHREGENLGVHLWRLVSKEVYCQPIVISFFVILLIKISWFSLVALKILCL